MALDLVNEYFVDYISKKRVFIKSVLVVCATILVLVFFDDFRNGNGYKSVYIELFLPAIFLLQAVCLKTRLQRRIHVPLKLYFEQDKVMLIYEYIDRKDKRGVHKETYIYTSKNTIELKKDLIINRICISGYPEYFSEYKNKKFNERITDEQIDFLLVMPDGGLRQQIIDGLQNSLKREIMEG